MKLFIIETSPAKMQDLFFVTYNQYSAFPTVLG